jgi:hypothetical protein
LKNIILKEGKLPAFITTCVALVEKRGLNSQGIYRLSGNSAIIQRVKAQANLRDYSELINEETDINVVAGVFKC